VLHSLTRAAVVPPEVFNPGHLGELTAVISPEMVDAALETVGGLEQRQRTLPSRVVVYLLLAGALFAGQGWQQVWARLTAGQPAAGPRPARSSITAAMRRVGAAPLRELFTHVAGPPATCARHTVRFAGRLVVAIDGTQIPVADSEANRVMFPKPRPGPNGEAGYPMIRMVAIIATGTRHVIDAVFGTDQIGELTYAGQVVGALQSSMLLLGDRNFATYRFFAQVRATGADFLLRGKTGYRAMTLPVHTRLPDGSFLSDANGTPVRVIDATVTLTTSTSTEGEDTASTSRTTEYRLITSLLDPAEASAEHLMRLYHERWEIETAYCELKSTILGGRVLRARYPSGVTQELWAILAVYQGLRTAITDALLHRPDIDPDRASFTIALHTAREQITTRHSARPPTSSNTVDLIGKIGAAILAALLPTRRSRTRPRVIKRAISKYRAKGQHIDRRTYPATVTVKILTPASDP
jgi:hypothetical protein